ncbi:MAG TPA: Crp/Fnr family transcriptional regulator [Usitatibacter sp.]|nr:Crp/Fnr family transcriptional regulator [Usitatibacter sp.]
MSAIVNTLLASLPRKAYQDLAPALAPMILRAGDVIYEPAQAIAHVYFPEECLLSLFTTVVGHVDLEIAMVGREGMLGISLAFGDDVPGVRAIVQGGGAARRLERRAFVLALRGSAPLRRAVYGYVGNRMDQVVRNVACTRFHSLESRLARKLLMTRDSLKAGAFRMTQELLSSMLGVRREGVTEAASNLRRRKLIEYSRGHILIVDVRGLETASCPCYAAGKRGARRP